MKSRDWFLFLIAGVLWGIPYLFISIAVNELSPAIVIVTRSTVGALILGALTIAQKTFFTEIRHWKLIFIYAIGELIGPWFFITHAQEKLSSGLTSLLVCTTPIWATVFASIYGDKSVWEGKRIVGLGVGFTGIIFLVGLETFSNIGNGYAIGEVLLASIGYAWAVNMIIKKLPNADLLAINAVALAITSLVYLPIALFNLPTEMPSTKAITSLIVLGVFCTGGGFISFFLVIRKMGAARASLVTYMNVMVAILLGIIVLSEPITLGILIGLPLVLVGSYLASRKHESAVIQ